jgi:hypothetical protein
VSVILNVIYDQLNHDSLVPTSLQLQLADQSIRRLVGIAEDIPMRIRNSFMPVDFGGTRNGCLSLDTSDSWEAILEYHQSHNGCCS